MYLKTLAEAEKVALALGAMLSGLKRRRSAVMYDEGEVS